MLQRFINGLVDIIYPRACLLCKKTLKNTSSIDNLVCMRCWSDIKKNRPPFCHNCGRQLGPYNLAQNICAGCRNKQFHFDRAFSPCAYEGALKDLIHQFKYKDKEHLGITLSKLMVEYIKEYNLPMEEIDFIIPMPLHKTKLREREFNQAAVLSNAVAHAFGKNILNGALKRSRLTQSQTELEDNARFLNVKNSFALDNAKNIKEKNILLVDDVLTTGATSSEAAYALKGAGARSVFVLTLAN